MDLWYIGKLVLSVIMALLPAIIWIQFLNRKKEQNPKLIIWVFIYGVLSVLPILSLQYLWLHYTNNDLYDQIQGSTNYITFFQDVHLKTELGFILTFMAVGVIEEIAKFSVLRYVDLSKIKIKNINDALKYIIVAALGFAFVENILYFSSFLLSKDFGQIFYNVTFRSIFTTSAHMVFSGIIGYHYALGKFSKAILTQLKWEGEEFPIIEKLSKTFKISQTRLFRTKKILQGLGLAIILHASFNYFLQKGLLNAALLLVIIGGIIVYYLMKMKSGYMIFFSKKSKSMMAAKDEEVIIELLGKWLMEEKYKEVEEICDRLLQRDPDNNIVRLFKAKAHDKLKLEKAFGSVKALFMEDDYKDRESIFEKYKILKEKTQEASWNTQKNIKKRRK